MNHISIPINVYIQTLRLRNIIAALFYVIVFEMKYVWSDESF